MASGFTEFRKPQIDSVTTRPKREKLGCLSADCLFIEQHYQQPDSIEATGFCACNLCDKLAIYRTAKRRSTRKVLYCLYMLLLRVRWRRDNNSVLLADYKTSRKEFDEITTILNFSGAWVQGSCICMKVFRYSFWETTLMFFNHLHLSLSDRYKISPVIGFELKFVKMQFLLKSISLWQQKTTNFEIDKIRILCGLDLLLKIRFQERKAWCLTNNLSERSKKFCKFEFMQKKLFQTLYFQ